MYGLILDINIPDLSNRFLNWVQNTGQWLLQLLPLSPFRRVIDSLDNIPYMYMIKWFIPIDEAILLLMYWGSAIAVYYAYMIILRWIKAID